MRFDLILTTVKDGDEMSKPILLLQEADGSFYDIPDLGWLCAFLTSLPIGVKVFENSRLDLLYEEDPDLTRDQAWEKRNELIHELQKTYPYEGAELEEEFFCLQTHEDRAQIKEFVKTLINHKGEDDDH